MYQVFNMGHRMELYVNQEIAADIIKISESFNIPAQIIGRVEASEDKKINYKEPLRNLRVLKNVRHFLL